MAEEKAQQSVRQVPADLVEGGGDNLPLGHWVLASPMLIFLAWMWVDVFAHFSPIDNYWIDALLALLLYVFVFVLPVGMGVFYLVTSFPGLFNRAGWDVQPLESVSEGEFYTVRYRFQARRRAPTTWRQSWQRAGQGWFYLEMAAILIGGVAMIPIFFSASEFGFGQ